MQLKAWLSGRALGQLEWAPSSHPSGLITRRLTACLTPAHICRAHLPTLETNQKRVRYIQPGGKGWGHECHHLGHLPCQELVTCWAVAPCLFKADKDLLKMGPQVLAAGIQETNRTLAMRDAGGSAALENRCSVYKPS